MNSLEAVCNTLAGLAPLKLAESWDNVGLLVGDRKRSLDRIMTCLTITPDVVDEAIDEKADLIVAHHPLPFHPVKRITTDTIPGTMLLSLIHHNVGIYSAHTAFDSATEGINQMWAQLLALESIAPLVAHDETESSPTDGSGRYGILPQPESLSDLVIRAAKAVGATAPRIVGPAQRPVKKIALACGSGGSFLADAHRCGCDAMITGEATFHGCLEAEALGIGLGLLGHYASERFAMERLAERLADALPDLTVWASRNERDPIVGLA